MDSTRGPRTPQQRSSSARASLQGSSQGSTQESSSRPCRSESTQPPPLPPPPGRQRSGTPGALPSSSLAVPQVIPEHGSTSDQGVSTAFFLEIVPCPRIPSSSGDAQPGSSASRSAISRSVTWLPAETAESQQSSLNSQSTAPVPPPVPPRTETEGTQTRVTMLNREPRFSHGISDAEARVRYFELFYDYTLLKKAYRKRRRNANRTSQEQAGNHDWSLSFSSDGDTEFHGARKSPDLEEMFQDINDRLATTDDMLTETTQRFSGQTISREFFERYFENTQGEINQLKRENQNLVALHTELIEATRRLSDEMERLKEIGENS